MSARPPGVAILGCGLIGGKRAAALERGQLVACTDIDPARAAALARQHPGAVAETVDAALARPEVEIAIVATPTKHSRRWG